MSSNGFQLADNEISSGPEGGPPYGVHRIDGPAVTLDGNLVLAGRGGASSSRHGRSAPLR